LGNENAVEDDYTVDPETLYMRTYFLVEDCQYGPFLSQVSIDANPPRSGRSYQLPPGADIVDFVDTTTFNPLIAPTYRISLWNKFDQVPAGVGDYGTALLIIYSFGAGGGEACTLILYPSGVGGYSLLLNYGFGTPIYSCEFTTVPIPGFDSSQWHHICVIKNATSGPSDNLPEDFEFFVDGVSVAFTQTQNIGAIAPMTVTLFGIDIINGAQATADNYLDEVYMDLLSDRTNVSTVLMPNLMDQVYGSGWLFWYRAEVPDDLTAPPWSTPNAPNMPFLRDAGSPPGILSTDVPPLLA
jgi:hypothetical protein